MSKDRYQFIGQVTGKVYASCEYKRDCFKKLQEKYPSISYDGYHHQKGRSNSVYPEPLLIIKKDV